MKKIVRVLTVSVLASALVVSPVLAEPSVEDLEKEKTEKQAQVDSLQATLQATLGKIDELSAKLVTTGEKVIQAEADLKDAEAKEEKQNQDMAKRIKYMYENGNESVVQQILEAQSIADMINSVELYNQLYTVDREELNNYIATKESVSEMKASLETEMATLEDTQTQFAQEKANLEASLVSAENEVTSVNAALQEAVEARRAAEEAAAAQAAAEAAAAQAAAEAAQNQNNNANSGSGTSTGTGSDTSTGTGTGSSNGSGSSNGTGSGTGGGYQGQGNTAAAQTIVSAAYSQLGVPYVWGGTSPGVGLDCSGLTQYCHAVAGISIPRVDTGQRDGGQWVSDPQPGDIAWTPGHVAIYIGGGQMIEAPQPGQVVCISAVRASIYVRYW